MGRVDVEWRRGVNGLDGTYTFTLRPSLGREETGQKFVEFKIPLMNGSITQLLGKDSRNFGLRGVLVEVDGDYDSLDKQRRDLVAGVNPGNPGQLHIISNTGHPLAEHLFYKGVPTRIEFSEQTNPKILDYRIEILLSDPTENIV